MQSVSENKTEEIDYSKGTVLIENILLGNVTTTQGFSVKAGDNIAVKWQNSNTFSCRFGFSENERGIWFLQIDEEGKIKSLSPSSEASMSELAEVKKHLKKRKHSNKAAKIINTRNDIEQMSQIKSVERTPVIVEVSLLTEESKQKEYSPFQAFLVILVSVSLYYLLYRSRFKIR
ncbi:MAG: hypothetical protein M3525_07610 [Acidobacteriota bacterium]|nr:hypothetical protein [Acidobacteriota bacterium]